MNKTIIRLAILMLFGCNSSEKSNSIEYSTDRITEAIPFAKGVISTEDNSEFSLMFTPDGRKVYFT